MQANRFSSVSVVPYIGYRTDRFLWRGHRSCVVLEQNKPRAPVTPDGRYFVVRGRLWRCSNPKLSDANRKRLTCELMQARSAKGRAMRAGDIEAREHARQRVDAAKHALGERGDPWWTDGAPDFNRHLVKNTPYAEWFASLDTNEKAS